MYKVIAICSFFALLFLTCVTGVLSTHKRIQRYFDMPAYMGAIPENVRSAVLQDVELGSSRQKVDRYLRDRGIGNDGDSICKLSNLESRLTCELGIRNHIWNLVRERCSIVFAFGSDDKLRNVQFQSMLEGPG